MSLPKKKKKKKKNSQRNSKDPKSIGHLMVDEEYEDDPEEKEQMIAFKPKRNYDIPPSSISPTVLTPNAIADLAEHKKSKPNLA